MENSGGRSLTILPLVVGTQAGIFDEDGISIELINVQGAPPTLAALFSGSGDVALMSLDAVGQAADLGQDLVYLCGRGLLLTALLARADTDLPSTEDGSDWEAVVRALEGKRVGVAARGGGVELRLTAALEEVGLSGDAVTWVAVGVGPTSQAALAEDQVDVVAEGSVNHAESLASGDEVVLAELSDGPAAFRNVLFGVGATRDWAEQNPNEAARLCAAVARSVDHMVDDANTAEIDQMLADEFDLGQDSLPLAWRQIDTFQAAMSEDDFDDAVSVSVAAGLFEKQLTYDETVLNSGG